jgi:hypothetical protein
MNPKPPTKKLGVLLGTFLNQGRYALSVQKPAARSPWSNQRARSVRSVTTEAHEAQSPTREPALVTGRELVARLAPGFFAVDEIGFHFRSGI